MVRDEADLHYAFEIQKHLWDKVHLPVVPLFETRSALAGAADIISRFLDSHKEYQDTLRKHWRSRVEVMLGYSDSAKEIGVLASRVHVAQAMHEVEDVLSSRSWTPVFFHGTGGSVARGGGAVEEQTAWWTPSARRIYKVTVQGEMVARSFASPEHFLGHIQKIDNSCRKLSKKSAGKAPSPLLVKLARLNAEAYQQCVESPEFLSRVEQTTLYPFLHSLKIGSRPSKRKGLSKVTDLRAIPWVLCWTQARVLFPSWWGFRKAWEGLSSQEHARLRSLAARDPLLATYLKQLGFTLSKVDFAPWFSRIEERAASDAKLLSWRDEFKVEFQASLSLLRRLSGSRNPLWFRPWLGESIHLRRTMIYPLNLLQHIAEDENDEKLLRLSVTGIASGMLTSG